MVQSADIKIKTSVPESLVFLNWGTNTMRRAGPKVMHGSTTKTI